MAKNISQLTLIGAVTDALSIPIENGIQTYRMTAGMLSAYIRASIGNLIFSTGDAKITFKTVADSGWILADDGSIGSATSGATTRANADTVDLYTLIWNNLADAQAAVNGGRGASAAADFGANKKIALPKALGRALAVAGAGSGLSSRALGYAIGEESHILTVSEMPSHTHTQNSHNHTQDAHAHGISNGTFATNNLNAYGRYATASNFATGSSNNATATNQPATAVNNYEGGGVAHFLMQPTAFVNYMIKL